MGWTGFQSIRPDGGYLIVYREFNERSEARLSLWGLAGRTIECTCLAGCGADFTATPDETGALAFGLEKPVSFALYADRIRP